MSKNHRGQERQVCVFEQVNRLDEMLQVLEFTDPGAGERFKRHFSVLKRDAKEADQAVTAATEALTTATRFFCSGPATTGTDRVPA